MADLETKFKHCEKHYWNYVYKIYYSVCKQQLDAISKEKAKGIKTRCKCNCNATCFINTLYIC